MRAAWRSVLITMLVAPACLHIPVAEPLWVVDKGVRPNAASAARSTDPRLSALADRIYPGPQTDLRSRMAPDLLADVDEQPEGVNPQYAAEQALMAALLHWREAEAIDEPTMRAVARAVARAEGLAEAGREPELQLVLIDAYAAIDERIDEAGSMFTGPPEVVHALLRRTAASLLRSHASHPQVPAVLMALSEAARRREDFELAAEILRVQVEWLGAQAGTVHLWAQAEACYRALTPACGDAATARLRAAGDDVGNLQWLADQVGRVTGPTPTDVAGLLDRADGLRALERLSEAAQLYARAAEAAPSDARPRVGQARLALLRGDPDAALAQLTAARAMDHRGRDYHELAIALRWSQLADESTRGAALAELQGLVEGYRRIEPARAMVLGLLLKSQTDGGAGLAGEDQARIAGLVREFPGSPDVRRLAYVAAQIAPSAELALAAVRAPLPAEMDRSIAALRTRTWFDVAARWDLRGELPGIVGTIGGWPEADRGELWATALAARATLAGEPMPPAVLEFFTRLAGEDAPESRARAFNNLAVLGAQAEVEARMKQWTEALDLGHEVDVVRLNMAGMFVQHEPSRPQLGPLLSQLAEGSPQVGLLALALRYRLAARTHGAERRARADLAAAVRAFRADNPGAALPGRWGMLAGTPRMRLGYADDRLDGAEIGGLRLMAEVERTYWFVAPIDLEAPRASRVKVASVVSRSVGSARP